MSKAARYPRGSDFSLKCLFLLLTIGGISLIPYLSIQLYPSPKKQKLTLQYEYPNASPEVLEKEVTARLESICARMKGLQSIQSTSGFGSGSIELLFDQDRAMDQTRFELQSLIRQVYPRLPQQLSYPQISQQTIFGQQKKLLVYALTGKAAAHQLEQWAKTHFIPALASLKGINQIKIHGASHQQWSVRYDLDRLRQFDLKPSDISKALQAEYQLLELGWTEKMEEGQVVQQLVQLEGGRSAAQDWSQLPIAQREGRIHYLGEVAHVDLEQQPPNSHYRINGREVIHMIIHANPNVNQIQLANKAKERIQQARQTSNDQIQLHLAHDATKVLREELQKMTAYTLSAIAILLLFVLLASQSWRYTLIISMTVVANMGMALLFYYALGIDLHLYSLIGITVSLGIVIDNSIVMLDQLRKHRSSQLFLAILAATLTSMGAIVLLFLLDESKREALGDFALVFIINLSLSLLISLLLTPALFRSFNWPDRPLPYSDWRKRISQSLNHYYKRYILSAYRFRRLAFALLLLLFGFPVFLLPDRIYDNSDWANRYNTIFGNSYYQQHLKRYVNYALGGTLRLFLDDRSRFSPVKKRSRNSLQVSIHMEEGHQLEQMDQISQRLEQFILRQKGVEQIQALVNSPFEANIEIYFHPTAESSNWPTLLKRQLLAEVNQIGSADFKVLGHGPAFDNELQGQFLNQHILLNGYHYDELKKQAAGIEKALQSQQRIQGVFTSSRPSFYAPKSHLRYFHRPIPEQLEMAQLSLPQLAQKLSEQSPGERSILSLPYGKYRLPVFLKPQSHTAQDQWYLLHQSLPTKDQAFTRLNQLSHVNRKKGYEEIVRLDQQYQLAVGYNYVGHARMASQFQRSLIDTVRQALPLGYTVANAEPGFWEKGKGFRRILLSIGMAVLMIFIIGSILFNSIRQALMAIAMIPFAFIGLFLSTYFFEFHFDQGGYAAFLLLSGLSVNAVFFIVNDYNLLKKQSPDQSELSLYLAAFQAKIIPIALMVLSTVLGLLPFLLFGQAQAFWYPLAICTIGGLLFSILGLFFYLPLLFAINPRQNG
ncbi:MAG: efflux RND transporter permease subunit [Bacteroidota bacterium]